MLNETALVKRNILVALVAWSAVVAGSLAWGLHGIREESMELAHHEAHAYINKDIALRRWATSHGGVYVPPTAATPPNPYLAPLVPDRDVVTTGGMKLTLMNPAYVLREVQSGFASPFGERGRITSLKPLNPANAPDAWERQALERIERGEKEVNQVSDIGGVPYLRLMRPIMVEAGCLKCHAQQGYKQGDIRGGIDVSVPLKSFNEAATLASYKVATGHAIVWAAGLLILIVFGRRALRRQAERSRAAAEIRKLNEELEQKVVERTRQLTEAHEELVRKEKLAVLGQVAGSVAHELRNPLGVMSNAVYFLQTVLSGTDKIALEYLNIIKNEIAVSERMAADLMDAVHTRPPQPQAVGARELIVHAVEKCSIPSSVRLALDVPEAISPLEVDPRQIGVVLCKLIDNALDAMPEGGTLQIGAAADPARKTVTISVRDSGVGMTPEQLGKLFQPLYTTKARGIGLGLVVVKNLTEANGGKVEMQSEAGKGTTFSVTVPAAMRDERNAV